MLIKRVSPKDLPVGDEVKYILTADIQEMAKMVGMGADALRRELSYIREQPSVTPFYGMSRPEHYFEAFNGGATESSARVLTLSEVDVRVQDNIRMDASESFLIVPLIVMRPLFVGDLQASTEMHYELIPHIEVWEGGSDYDNGVPRRTLYQYTNSPELHPVSVKNDAWNSRIAGFDLVLLPRKPEAHVHSFSDPATSSETPNKLMTQQSVQKYIAGQAPQDVTYDYGFGVELQYTYTADMKDNLRIDHRMLYKGRRMYYRESDNILSPTMVLELACDAIDIGDGDGIEFEAYEIMRTIRDAACFEGIGYRRS